MKLEDVPTEEQPTIDFPIDLLQDFIAKLEAVNSASLDVIIVAAKCPDGDPVVCSNAHMLTTRIRLAQISMILNQGCSVAELGPVKKAKGE